MPVWLVAQTRRPSTPSSDAADSARPTSAPKRRRVVRRQQRRSRPATAVLTRHAPVPAVETGG